MSSQCCWLWILEELGKTHFVKPIFNFNVKLYSWPFKVVWRFQKVGVVTGIMGNNAIKRSINFKLHFVKLRSLILRKAASFFVFLFFFRKSTEMKGLGREKVWRPTAWLWRNATLIVRNARLLPRGGALEISSTLIFQFPCWLTSSRFRGCSTFRGTYYA